MNNLEVGIRLGVGIVLFNNDKKVFVGHRIDLKEDDPDLKLWQMPQGGIDENEQPLEAALRELYEETGIKPGFIEVIAQTQDWLTYRLPDELIGKVWGGKYHSQRQKWFLMKFTGTNENIDINIGHPEFSKWKWEDFDQLSHMVVPFKREIYKAIQDEFAWYFNG